MFAAAFAKAIMLLPCMGLVFNRSPDIRAVGFPDLLTLERSIRSAIDERALLLCGGNYSCCNMAVASWGNKSDSRN